jgi:cyanophycinase
MKSIRRTPRGTLIIIGGHEDKKGEKVILKEVAGRVGSGKLVVATVASSEAEEMWRDYRKVFGELGVRKIEHLDINSREEGLAFERLRILDGATVVFFTGGDQLRITTQLGDTPMYEAIQEIHAHGGTVAGTSAGASAMSETMLVSGPGDESHRVGSALRMAPGLGLIRGVVVDQHFAERGRTGRLVAAVGQNPRNLGVGLDENTAIVVHDEKSFDVIGDGAVYVVDGRNVTYSNLAEADEDETMAIYDIRLHVLNAGRRFDLETRRPEPTPAESAAEDRQREAVAAS